MAYGGNPTTMSIDPTSVTWNAFSVSSSSLSVGLAAAPDLTKVIGIGAYFQNERLSTNTGSMNFNITNIQFSAIPEPSAFAALAGLGALGMAATRRRRRARSFWDKL
jgi:hypothetical protein